VEISDHAATLPESWPDRYERLVADHDLETPFFPAGVALVQRLARQPPRPERVACAAQGKDLRAWDTGHQSKEDA